MFWILLIIIDQRNWRPSGGQIQNLICWVIPCCKGIFKRTSMEKVSALYNLMFKGYSKTTEYLPGHEWLKTRVRCIIQTSSKIVNLAIMSGAYIRAFSLVLMRFGVWARKSFIGLSYWPLLRYLLGWWGYYKPSKDNWVGSDHWQNNKY